MISYPIKAHLIWNCLLYHWNKCSIMQGCYIIDSWYMISWCWWISHNISIEICYDIAGPWYHKPVLSCIVGISYNGEYHKHNMLSYWMIRYLYDIIAKWCHTIFPMISHQECPCFSTTVVHFFLSRELKRLWRLGQQYPVYVASRSREPELLWTSGMPAKCWEESLFFWYFLRKWNLRKCIF